MAVQPENFQPNLNYPQPEATVFDAWREQGDTAAAEALIGTYGNFVIQVAHGYGNALQESRGIVGIEDLTQRGILSILTHGRTFDPTADVRFLAYAGKGIKRAVLTEHERGDAAIYFPADVLEITRDLRRIQREREASGKPPLSDQELASLLDIQASGPAIAKMSQDNTTVSQVRFGMHAARAESLNTIMDLQAQEEAYDQDNEASWPAATVVSSDHEVVAPEDGILAEVSAEAIKQAAEQLITQAFDHRDGDTAAQDRTNERMKAVITLYFGLGEADKAHTLEEIGSKFGATRQAAHYTYQKAMKRLQIIAERMGLDQYELL